MASLSDDNEDEIIRAFNSLNRYLTRYLHI